jgi:hypothetical protein
MTDWTIDDVADRLAEAAHTGRRLPPVKVQGYFNVWPIIVRKEWEKLAADGRSVHYVPPTPAAIDRMVEAMRWMQWIETEQRHLLWMRASDVEWKVICRRFGCDRTTAWRRWQRVLKIIADHLNGRS